MSRQTAVYPIGMVTRLTGLSPRRIRYYEQLGLVFPVRSKGNRRIYSTEDIDTLCAVKTLLKMGLSLQGINKIVQTRRVLQALEMKTSIPPPDHASNRLLNPNQPLTSLYPVNNQLLLSQLLWRHWEIKGDSMPDGINLGR